MSALDKQIGGSHYKDLKMQPYEFFLINQLPHHKSSICKRIMRYDLPTGGGLLDLEKIKHEVDLIIELEKWNEKTEKIKEKPPLGLKPQKLHVEERALDITDAMSRYIQEGKLIPKAWLNDIMHLNVVGENEDNFEVGGITKPDGSYKKLLHT